MASQPFPQLLFNCQDIQLEWKSEHTNKTVRFKPDANRRLPSLKMNQANNQFVTTVRPAISRGKNAILATDPEKHVRLERERLALYEQRNRPKTPVNLIPINVKALGPTPQISKSTPAKSKQNSKTILHHVQKQNSILKWWQSASANFGSNRNMSSILFKSSNENWAPSQTFQPYSQYKSLDRYGQTSKTQSIELEQKPPKPPAKIIPGYGNYTATKTSTNNQNFVLTAKQCTGFTDNVANTIDKVHSLNNATCCQEDDQSTDSPPKLPIIVTNRSDNSDDHSSSQSCSSTVKMSNDGRKQLVVQLPNITSGPSAPHINQSETPRQTLNKEKVEKLRELRKRELTELFLDIQELNAYNDTLTQTINEKQKANYHAENSVFLE